MEMIKANEHIFIREDYDKINKKIFMTGFNTKNGQTIRTGLLKDEKIVAPMKTIEAILKYLIAHENYDNSFDTGKDAFMGTMPELIDIGIIGHCIHGLSGKCKVQCYQAGPKNNTPNMTLENFKKIMEQVSEKVFQVALGGRGDCNKHENFEEILQECRKHNIVPNYTTSGFELTDREVELTKEYCGTVAVSEYFSDYTREAIKKFVKAGMTTNIHYVLSQASIDKAIKKLEEKSFDEGIYAVTFLLHKPVGLGSYKNVLSIKDPRVERFFELVDKGGYPFKIGFDSCSIPGIVNKSKNVVEETYDTCEGGRFSCYITPDMKMLPCSFDNQELKWAVDLNTHTMQEAWDSPEFEDFRKHLLNSCPSCPKKGSCMGGCPIRREIVLCNRKEKDLK